MNIIILREALSYAEIPNRFTFYTHFLYLSCMISLKFCGSIIYVKNHDV
jgi:hypothetical protein